jgi:hypothetical protein
MLPKTTVIGDTTNDRSCSLDAAVIIDNSDTGADNKMSIKTDFMNTVALSSVKLYYSLTTIDPFTAYTNPSAAGYLVNALNGANDLSGGTKLLHGNAGDKMSLKTVLAALGMENGSVGGNMECKVNNADQDILKA